MQKCVTISNVIDQKAACFCSNGVYDMYKAFRKWKN